jgi:UDP-2-acetamido-2,6-beta-L-arabino-hexul-4-ose reductase
MNRTRDVAEFETVNVGFTCEVLQSLRRAGRKASVVYSSSTQASANNPYGQSKRAAESEIARYAATTGSTCRVYRLTNVFGKWATPNYNSAVATFCHNAVFGLASTIHDPAAPLRLVYIDDVCSEFLSVIDHQSGRIRPAPGTFSSVEPTYDTSVGEVHSIIARFAEARENGTIMRVGSGLVRALYATYLSYLPPDRFAYTPPMHVDPRGSFAEIVRTQDSGQVSFFTAHPGVTRGGHYHHTKNEKFLVLRGRARFRFRDVRSGAETSLEVSGGSPQVVETVPGWAHDITNIGDEEIVVMLWANEAFDRDRPDTIPARLGP